MDAGRVGAGRELAARHRAIQQLGDETSLGHYEQRTEPARQGRIGAQVGEQTRQRVPGRRRPQQLDDASGQRVQVRAETAPVGRRLYVRAVDG